jgi:hypothetical protein
MGDKPKRGGGRRSDITEVMANVRKAYEDGVTNLSELSRTFTVKRDTIARYRDEEKWATKGQINEAARNKVIDIATRKAVDRVDPEALANLIADELKMGAALSGQMLVAAHKLLQKYVKGRVITKGERKGEWVPGVAPGFGKGDADALSALADAVKKAVAVGREIHGLRAGEPNVKDAPDSAPGKEYVVAIKPQEAESA